ncbi:hypothetical protein FWH13_00815 [Candidatus Saccharibacteria bacterium]|nr:hypothetical protein [Candidatus Saccharibacteria bacterium]
MAGLGVFLALSATLIGHFQPSHAAPVSGAVGMRVVLDYSITLTLGDAYSDCPAKASGVVPISPTPGDQLYYACINATVDTDNPTGYNLTMQTTNATNNLIHTTIPANVIPSTTATIQTPSMPAGDTWGFCIPGATYMQGVANGFTACGSGEGSGSSLTYAAIPLTATEIKNVNTIPTTAVQRNTPIRFGVHTTAATSVGTYTSTIRVTAALNAPGSLSN